MNRLPPGLGTPSAAGGDPLVELLQILGSTRPGADIRLIKRAYDVAAHWHRGQHRRSGDAYITHPLAVATIVAGLGADDQTLCAALLHDTVGGTQYTLNALGADFGPEIAALVDGVAAFDRLAVAHAMAAAMSGDIRIPMIKLADRLHNMRTLRHLTPAKQELKSRQVLEVFAPLAHRLGMDTIKSELEDLASARLHARRQAATARTTSERMLAATTVLLPPAARARWREEWLAELQMLPTRRMRASFAAQTLRGMPRLASTLRRPAAGNSRAR